MKNIVYFMLYIWNVLTLKLVLVFNKIILHFYTYNNVYIYINAFLIKIL